MSEHITHIAFYEDSTRLIRRMSVSNAFKEAVKNQPDAGLIASGARGNHLFAVPIIEEVRDRWEKRKKGDEEKLAAAIGWLCHRAIDLQVKPNYLKSEEINDAHFSVYENQIYYDAITFDKVYDKGKRPSISPRVAMSASTLETDMRSHRGATLIHQDKMEELLCRQTQFDLMALRQFNETAKSIDAWLDEFPSHYQALSENLEVYIEAFENPDPRKMKRYAEDLNFYNDQDELIRLVRELQISGTTSVDLESAVKKAENQSHYAQGLSRSYRFIQAADDFFNHRISKPETYDKVEIFHEPHRK